MAGTEALPGASVVMISTNDTLKRLASQTNLDGFFSVEKKWKGGSLLRISYIGFQLFEKEVSESEEEIGKVELSPLNLNLKEVVAEEKMIRVQQMGDTSQYNAAAYKVNKDANTEDLLQKMPGLVSENGVMKAQGEEVKRVLLDGKEYFGDDVNTVLKNLPAEVIDKIQVFDRLSEQSQLTGFNDGNTIKTINIVTKPEKSQGQFGKVYAGTDLNRYQAGLNLNLFSKKRRISIIGQSNNINQQNFATQDLSGIFGQQNQRMPGMGGGGGGMGRGMGRPSGQGNDAENFNVNSLPGITTTHALGVNYSETFKSKTTLSASYFFNYGDNQNTTGLLREFFSAEQTGINFTEDKSQQRRNINNRLNARLEWKPDTFTTVTVVQRFTMQHSNNTTQTFAATDFVEQAVSNSSNTGLTKNLAYNSNTEINWQQKLAKKGRTFSLSANPQWKSNDGNSSNALTNNSFALDSIEAFSSNQQGNTFGYTLSVSGSINYTEPLGEKGILETSYQPSISRNLSDRQIKSNPSQTDISFLETDSSLSNRFVNDYLTHRTRLAYRHRTDIGQFMFNVSWQHAELTGNQEFPAGVNVSRTFNNVLPGAMYMFNKNKSTNFRLFYRTAANAPSVSQLQPVYDVSNPQSVSVGNPLLRQDYSHFLVTRYNRTNASKGTNFFAFLMFNTVRHYIGNESVLVLTDTLLGNGVLLNRGSRLNIPRNLQGYYTVRSMLNGGMPISFLKCNLNLSGGYTYTRTPGITEHISFFTNSHAVNSGFVLGSNISEDIDFSLGMNATYNRVRSTLPNVGSGDFYTHTLTAKLNYVFLNAWVITTELNQTQYTGIGNPFNTTFWLWTGSFARKLGKARNAEIRLSCFDILGQNLSISRSFSDVYVETLSNTVLNRYYMLNITYNLRRFGNNKSADKPNRETQP